MSQPWEINVWLEDREESSFHAKLVNQLTSDIQAGRLKPGMAMPGSRSMAQRLGVNRKTVQLAYEELESQGWLFASPRRGTFVADVLPEQSLTDKNRKLLNIEKRSYLSGSLVSELYRNSLTENHNGIGANDGVPDPRLIPYELLSKAYRRAIIQSTRKGELGYGDPRGVESLRRSIMEMLAMDRFMNPSLEEICVVRGSQMGIYLASRVLNPQDGVIVCEELSYPPAVAAFESNGFQVVRCALDLHGLNTDALRAIIQQHKVAAVYTTPHHQYPTTVSMSMERRLMLLALSNEYRFWILEDDYDHEFHYESRPIPPLSSLNGAENVVHIGSMSKVFSPALRLGYIAADKRFIDLVAKEILLIDRQGNTITELAVSYLMESGDVKRHIRKMRKNYQLRRDFAMCEFYRVFGDDVVIEKPAGGMALWIDLQKITHGKSADRFSHPDFNFNKLFNTEKNNLTHIRFGFGALEQKEITASIEQLAKMLS